METIKEVLMRRDDMSSEDADDLISEAEDTLNGYLMDDEMELAYDICSEYFGLEPDYLIELMNGSI